MSERNVLWRRRHPEKWAATKKRNYDRGGVSTGLPWTQQEDRRVLEHSVTDRELAIQLNRSVRAIQVRRTRLKSRLEGGQS